MQLTILQYHALLVYLLSLITRVAKVSVVIQVTYIPILQLTRLAVCSKQLTSVCFRTEK